MNPGATAERVLDALRGQIAHNTFRPGERLDPAMLAGELSASVTPVRDALNRLTGEGLVEVRHAGGFYLPSLDEPLLHDLYEWSAQLLVLAIGSWPRYDDSTSVDGVIAVALAPVHRPTDDLLSRTHSREMLAQHTNSVFAAIAARSTNSVHRRNVSGLNERLHAIRRIEPTVLPPAGNELEPWLDALARKDRPALRKLIMRYHRRRQRSAAAIVRASYRSP